MKQIIYKWIFFKLMVWKIVGEMNPNIKKSIMIVVPHTSWHDFYIGLFARGIIGLEMNYVAKKELFIFPFGAYFRWMGGAPLDRSGGKNIVDSIVSIFKSREVFRLAIAPEGTRKKVTEWKTGFYYIALKAEVPIIPIAFDYGKKQVVLNEPFYPTGNIEADFEILKSFYKDVIGKIPENSF
ncbi:1-acyl-sn-glycerol-3-phosphate acyltransferase [Flavobacterium arsenatis]|uniref:1-acyl-sn-glycerol-3-phosphate acyltransferase n=1 Tax=Flavobacterium arsenatis TaxID=1484332 RepID=A0ABU1TRF6_9FLAO|nr:1-acyl-sn-glycerol-3-phosphate acyltransferase [Flavobacterium arsenatis]MDR6968454.1 1-acyl-sn-glycerol-3-phosphate acyltransferase [Flavobacterium arsenatis]